MLLTAAEARSLSAANDRSEEQARINTAKLLDDVSLAITTAGQKGLWSTSVAYPLNTNIHEVADKLTNLGYHVIYPTNRSRLLTIMWRPKPQ